MAAELVLVLTTEVDALLDEAEVLPPNAPVFNESAMAPKADTNVEVWSLLLAVVVKADKTDENNEAPAAEDDPAATNGNTTIEYVVSEYAPSESMARTLRVNV